MRWVVSRVGYAISIERDVRYCNGLHALAGMTTLAGAIASGSLAALEDLYLGGNQIGDEGMSALAGAISSGSMLSVDIRVESRMH